MSGEPERRTLQLPDRVIAQMAEDLQETLADKFEREFKLSPDHAEQAWEQIGDQLGNLEAEIRDTTVTLPSTGSGGPDGERDGDV